MGGFKKKSNRVELNNDFIDREDHQYAFRRHLFNVKNLGIDGGLLLIYSGVGQVGKTSLLKQFEKILAYEKLTGEEQGKKKYGRLISENRDVPVDWWVGYLLTAERVMWVIAGRYKIKEIGEVDLEGGTVENYTVDVFDKNWSNKYLTLQGIAEEELRTAVINLTGGHPYYLRKCAETYVNYKDKGKVPRPSDFGKNLDDIVEKTVGSLDENGQRMTQCLCILKNWTDEVAANVIGNFSNVTYNRVKKMIARAEPLSFDEIGYTFDKTIAAFLFPSLKRDVTCHKLFTDIRAAANVYFKNFFDEGNLRRLYDSDSKHNYYFGMWSEIILLTTDAPAELMTLYDGHFEPLEERFDDLTLEIIFKKFFNKVGDNETLPSAYFQNRLGAIRYRQDRKKEALELAKEAYYKVENFSFSNDELPFKISIMNILAEMFWRLSRHKDEIPLREKIIRECERCFTAKDERTIKAKKELATALEWGDRKNEALEIRRQIFELFDEHDEENYIVRQIILQMPLNSAVIINLLCLFAEKSLLSMKKIMMMKVSIVHFVGL